MTHLSHAYPQGANLYFIFIARMDDIGDYLSYQAEILDAILARGPDRHAAAPALPGSEAALRSRQPYKPGGTLALDLPDSERRGIPPSEAP